MRATTLIATLALTGGILGAGAVFLPAFAQGDTPTAASQSQWMSLQQLQSRLAAVGFHDFEEIERKSDKYEVKATDPQGRRVELYVDPVTGEILKIETEGGR